MSQNKQKTEYKASMFLVVAIILVSVILLTYGVVFDLGKGNKSENPTVRKFEETTRELGENPHARIIKLENQTAVISGGIVGANSGMKPVLESVKRANPEKVRILIDTELEENQKRVLPSFYTYNYRLKIENITTNDVIVVKQNNKTYELSPK